MAHRPIAGRLVIATHNPGKLAEMRDLLAIYGVDAISAGELGLPEPEETGTTFRANARIKAQAAAKAANWQARPSPIRRAGLASQDQPASSGSATLSGRGIACVCYEGDNGYVAMVAEVDVNQSTGQIHVTRLVVAQDCGPISNPDGMRNQIEGGALQGMSRALGEAVTWDEEKVTSIDWRSYHSLPVGFAIPRIETVLINQPDQEACGSGETAITVVAAAIGNAIFDATGVRIREVPFTPERVKAAINSRS